jgi:hypothetical protein
MSRKKLVAIALVLAAAVPAVAFAQSLKEKQQIVREEEILQKAAKDMNDACKTSIKALGDWASFKGKLVDDQNHHVAGMCGHVMDTIASMCHSGDVAKKAVRDGISTFVCTAGKTDFNLNKKTFTHFTYEQHSKPDVPKCVRDFLGAKL